MYEHMRHDLVSCLAGRFSTSETETIVGIFDKIAANYSIKEKETSLVVYSADRLPQIVKIYLNSKRLEGLSENSLELYEGRLKIFNEAMQKDLLKITTNEIRLFLVTYQEQSGCSDRTLDKFRQIINGFYKWLIDEEYLEKNPCKNIKEIKYHVEPRKSLTRFQLERLRREAKKDARLLAIIDVLYSTGCRVSELVNLKKSDINPETYSATIKVKGGKYHTVYFNEQARLSLDEYLKTRKDNSDYLFVGSKAPYNRLSDSRVQEVFRKLSKKLGFELSPHIMRHTTATLALQAGMELSVVQQMLGHANINTTRIYAETSDEQVNISHKKYVV